MLIRNVQHLAWTSSISSVLLLVGLIGCISFFNIDLEIAYSGNWVNLSSLFVILGLVTASFEGIGLVIPVEESIGLSFTPNPYDQMLNIALGIATTILAAFGIGGYLTFGGNQLVDVRNSTKSDTESTESVFSLNLPMESPTGFLLSVSFTVAIFLTYPLQMFPAVEVRSL